MSAGVLSSKSFIIELACLFSKNATKFFLLAALAICRAVPFIVSLSISTASVFAMALATNLNYL